MNEQDRAALLAAVCRWEARNDAEDHKKDSFTSEWSWPIQVRKTDDGRLEARPLTRGSALAGTYNINTDEPVIEIIEKGDK